MYYIYTLSIKGRVFYVGCSADPVSRYKSHYHDQLSKCYDLVRYWLHHKNTPMDMTIIDAHDNKIRAFYFEQRFIDKYNAIYPLLNNQHFPYLYTTAFARIDKLKTADKIVSQLDNIKLQVLNYDKE